MDIAETQILHIKSKVSNMIRQNTFSIWKYPCIIVDKCSAYKIKCDVASMILCGLL